MTRTKFDLPCTIHWLPVLNLPDNSLERFRLTGGRQLHSIQSASSNAAADSQIPVSHGTGRYRRTAPTATTWSAARSEKYGRVFRTYKHRVLCSFDEVYLLTLLVSIRQLTNLSAAGFASRWAPHRTTRTSCEQIPVPGEMNTIHPLGSPPTDVDPSMFRRSIYPHFLRATTASPPCIFC